MLVRQGLELRSKVIMPEDRTAPRQVIEGEEKDYMFMRMRIRRKFIRKVGFTVGSPGRRAVNRGQPAVNHSEECRKKTEGMLREQGNEKVIRSDERIKSRNEEGYEKREIGRRRQCKSRPKRGGGRANGRWRQQRQQRR